MPRFGNLQYSLGYAVLHSAVKWLLKIFPWLQLQEPAVRSYPMVQRFSGGLYHGVNLLLPWVLPIHPPRPQQAFTKAGPPTFAETPLVTVITRTMVGREHFLKNAMASVVSQTWPHIEHWIIQDGDEDHEPHCLHGPQTHRPKGLPPVQVHFMPLASVGRSIAGNMGLQMAQGRWCLFLDDDDGLYPDHLTTLAEALINHPQCVAAYSLAEEVLSLKQGLSGVRDFSRRVPAHFQQPFGWDRLCQDNYFPIQSVLFEWRLFHERGGFHPNLEAMEDWNLWLRYAQGNQFHYVPRVTSWFRTPAHPMDRLARERMFYAKRAEVVGQNQTDFTSKERAYSPQAH